MWASQACEKFLHIEVVVVLKLIEGNLCVYGEQVKGNKGSKRVRELARDEPGMCLLYIQVRTHLFLLLEMLF